MSNEPGESPAERVDPALAGFDLKKASTALTNAVSETQENQRKRAEYRAALIHRINYYRARNADMQREYAGKRLLILLSGLTLAWFIRRS